MITHFMMSKNKHAEIIYADVADTFQYSSRFGSENFLDKFLSAIKSQFETSFPEKLKWEELLFTGEFKYIRSYK